jgi:hypothetical protein
MSSAGHTPTHRPLPEATPQFIGYFLALQFHPPIKLGRQAGWDFAAQLAGSIDPRGAKIEDTAWQFLQPLGDGGEFRVIVQEQTVLFDAKNPSSPLEWFETRCPVILEAFRNRFSPKLLLTSVAKAAATLNIDGDSRDFLTAHVMKMDRRRLGPLERPIHLLGLRLVLPAFEITEQPPSKRRKAKTVASADWQAEVKAESFAADSSKLFLEVSGQWPIGAEWNEQGTTAAVGRLETVKTFLRDHLLSFLTTELENGG